MTTIGSCTITRFLCRSLWMWSTIFTMVCLLSLGQLLCTVENLNADEPREPREGSSWREIAPLFTPPPQYLNQFGSYRSPLLMADGTKITQAQQWPMRRQEIMREWTRLMGPWPEVIEKPRVEKLSQETREGITQRRVRLEIAPGQSGDGWLLIPPAKQPMPAVLVVYYEPETSIGLRPENSHRDFGWQLAKRGFVTLNIGTPGGDARKPDIGNAKCQPLSFHAYVAANCWQILAGMPEVDSSRIGIVGHSYGGKWSMFGGALWDKFAAVATSDPGIAFDDSRPSINYWEPWYLGLDSSRENRKPGLPSESNPAFGAYKEMRSLERDLHELHALICPRPFFISGGAEDPANRWLVLNHSIAVNKLLGRVDRVGMSNRKDHAPDAESNSKLMHFFTHFLGPSSDRSK